MRYKITGRKSCVFLSILILWVSSSVLSQAARVGTIYKTDQMRNTAFYKGLEFQSELETDFQIGLVYPNGKTEALDAQINYTEHALKVTGLEACKVSELLNGDANLQIKYRMVFSDSLDREGIWTRYGDTTCGEHHPWKYRRL